jgi:hypothetical protein
MKSSVGGKPILKAEITNISPHGIWLYLSNKEYLLSFTDFPWFKTARISEIQNVKVLHKNHLYWPDLDVDLTTDIIEHLESYPLICR